MIVNVNEGAENQFETVCMCVYIMCFVSVITTSPCSVQLSLYTPTRVSFTGYKITLQHKSDLLISPK